MSIPLCIRAYQVPIVVIFEDSLMDVEGNLVYGAIDKYEMCCICYCFRL